MNQDSRSRSRSRSSSPFLSDSPDTLARGAQAPAPAPLSSQRAAEIRRIGNRQAYLNRRTMDQERADARVDWLVPSGELLPYNKRDFRFWGQYSGEVVLVLPLSTLTPWESAPARCYLTVDEIDQELKSVYCREPLPSPPPSPSVSPPYPAYVGHSAIDDDYRDHIPGGQEAPVTTPAPIEIVKLYTKLSTNCGFGRFQGAVDFNKWLYRSTKRMSAGQDELEIEAEEVLTLDDDTLPYKIFEITFRDIEEFVRQDPSERNLQNFVNERRAERLDGQDDPSFEHYPSFRSDLRYDDNDQEHVDARDDEFDSERDTGDEMSDSGYGGKRRKSTIKRNARRTASKRTYARRARSSRKYKKTTKRNGKKKTRSTRKR